MTVYKGYLPLSTAAAMFETGTMQEDAWHYLEDACPKEIYNKFLEIYWFGKGKKVKHKDAVALTTELSVPYFYQRDSVTGHGERMCQSSSIAMVIEYLDKDLLNDDDDYLRMVLKYGDTVSAAAHSQALAQYGVKASFHMDGTKQSIIDLLDKGVPVPIGILHKGHVDRPTGGGHWITVIGYDHVTSQFICHDPFGELDLIGGGYPYNRSGKKVRYSYHNLMKRWLISSDKDGWYWDFSGNE